MPRRIKRVFFKKSTSIIQQTVYILLICYNTIAIFCNHDFATTMSETIHFSKHFAWIITKMAKEITDSQSASQLQNNTDVFFLDQRL